MDAKDRLVLNGVAEAVKAPFKEWKTILGVFVFVVLLGVLLSYLFLGKNVLMEQ